jgi:hypothetical protein
MDGNTGRDGGRSRNIGRSKTEQIGARQEAARQRAMASAQQDARLMARVARFAKFLGRKLRGMFVREKRALHTGRMHTYIPAARHRTAPRKKTRSVYSCRRQHRGMMTPGGWMSRHDLHCTQLTSVKRNRNGKVIFAGTTPATLRGILRGVITDPVGYKKPKRSEGLMITG